ncbi:MAG: hypothetical protein JWQ03_1938 [Variovorax sp.]|nr:hypothetical protein [Variovorax sp.]
MNKLGIFRIPLLAAVLAVAGCGGGDNNNNGFVFTPTDNGQGQTTTIPASALGSVTTLMAYMKELVASNSETSEPVQLGDAVLPVDNTTEAAAL